MVFRHSRCDGLVFPSEEEDEEEEERGLINSPGRRGTLVPRQSKNPPEVGVRDLTLPVRYDMKRKSLHGQRLSQGRGDDGRGRRRRRVFHQIPDDLDVEIGGTAILLRQTLQVIRQRTHVQLVHARILCVCDCVCVCVFECVCVRVSECVRE